MRIAGIPRESLAGLHPGLRGGDTEPGTCDAVSEANVTLTERQVDATGDLALYGGVYLRCRCTPDQEAGGKRVCGLEPAVIQKPRPGSHSLGQDTEAAQDEHRHGERVESCVRRYGG